MTYFEKIEAYLSGEMAEVEQSIFEQALEENTRLQKEYEAYRTAQSLFNFSGKTLSEKEILSTNATETAENLINFTAQHLSEQEILETPKAVANKPQAVISTLNTRRNRLEWLVAASMLFVLSMIGARFYSQSNRTTNSPTNIVAEKPSAPKVEKAIETTKNNPTPVIIAPIATIVKETSIPKPASKYEPAKVRITPKVKPVVAQKNIVAVAKIAAKETPSVSPKPIAALLTTAEKIVTGKVIKQGEAVVYKAEESITLKPGFHAKAGADFIATSGANKEIITDLMKAEVIDQQQTVVYSASNTITLKPGFHAKAGSAFVAQTSNSAKSVSTNTVISDNESVIVKADNGITLKAGFHAKAGANFVAKVKK